MLMPKSSPMVSSSKRDVRGKAGTRPLSSKKDSCTDDECVYDINKLAMTLGMDNWELDMFLSACRKQKYYAQGLAILQAYSKISDDITTLLDDRSIISDRVVVALRSGQRVDLTELAQISLRIWMLICRWRQLQWSPQPIMSPTNPALSYLQQLYADTSELLPLVSSKDTIEDTSPISMGVIFAPVMDEASLFHLIYGDKPILAATEASIKELCRTMRSVIHAESQAERTAHVLASLKGGGQSSIPTLRLNYRNVAPPIMGSLSASHEVYSTASTQLHKLLATTYSIHDYVDDSYYAALTYINELNHQLQNQKSRAKSPLRPAGLLLQRSFEQVSEPHEQEEDEAILPSFTKLSPSSAPATSPYHTPATTSPMQTSRLPPVERGRNGSASTAGSSSHMTKQLQENLQIEAKEKQADDDIDRDVSKSADMQEVQPSMIRPDSPDFNLIKARSNSAPAHRRPMSRGRMRARTDAVELDTSESHAKSDKRDTVDSSRPPSRADSPGLTYELLTVTVPCVAASLGVECRRVRESATSYCLLIDRYLDSCSASTRKSLRVGDEILRIGTVDVQGMHHKEVANLLREMRPRSSSSKSPLPIELQIKRSSTASQSSTGLQSVEEGRDSQYSNEDIPPPPAELSLSRESSALDELSDQLSKKRSEIEEMESAMEDWTQAQFKSGKGRLLQLYSELRALQDKIDQVRAERGSSIASTPVSAESPLEVARVESPIEQQKHRKSGHSLAGKRLLETKSSSSIGSNSPKVVERRRYSSNSAMSRKPSAGRRRRADSRDSDNEDMTAAISQPIPEGRVFVNSPLKSIETTPSAMLLNLDSVKNRDGRSRTSSAASDEVEYLTTPHTPGHVVSAPVNISSPLKSGRKQLNGVNMPVAQHAINKSANRTRKQSQVMSSNSQNVQHAQKPKSAPYAQRSSGVANAPKSAFPKHMQHLTKLFARNESFSALQNALRMVDARKKPLVVTSVNKIIVWWRMVFPRKKLARRMEVRGLALEIIDGILDDSILTAIRLARGRDRMMRNGAAISVQYHFRRWRDRYLNKVKRIQHAWKRAIARTRIRQAVRIFRAAIFVYRFIYKRKKRLGHVFGKKILFRRVVRTFVDIYGIRQRESRAKVNAKVMLPMFAHMGQKTVLMGNDRRNKMHNKRFKAAAKIQSFWRMVLAMELLEKLRVEKEMRNKITTAILSFRLRRKILRRRQEKKCAMMVQKRWRGYLVRKMMMIKVLAGIKITSTWRRCRSYKKIKAHLRRIERPVEIVLHGLREIPPQMLYSKQIKVKISVWWSSLLHLVSQSDFETVINSKEPQVVYTTTAYPAVVQTEASALPQPKRPLNSSKSNDSSDGSAETADTASALAAAKQPSFQSPFPKDLSSKFPKPHIKRTISPVIESSLNEEDSSKRVPPKLDSGYLSRLPSIKDILNEARNSKDDDKAESPHGPKSPRSPSSSASHHSPRHTLGMMKHTAMQSLAMLKSFSNAPPTSPQEKPPPPPPGPKKNPRCMCDFNDATINIPGCHGNSVLRFDIYDGERKFASHVFYMSKEDRLLFWGGEYVRPVVISKVKRKVQLNASTITTRERSNMLDFDSSPVFEFRVVSGGAGKSMADWASVSIRGTGPLKLKMRTKGFIQSFFETWDRMFLSLTGEFLLFCESKKSQEPFLRLNVADIKSLKVELGKGATKKSSTLVEDLNDVILVTNMYDDVYIRFADAVAREKWVTTINKAMEDANNIFKRLNIPDVLASIPVANQNRRGGPRHSTRRSSNIASRQRYSLSG